MSYTKPRSNQVFWKWVWYALLAFFALLVLFAGTKVRAQQVATPANTALPGRPDGCTPRAQLKGKDTVWSMVPCRRLDVLEPHFAGQLECLMDRMVRIGGWKRPLIAETYRSNELQQWYYKQGRTRPGLRITNAKDAVGTVHFYAMAADIVHNNQQWGAPAKFWNSLALHAEECGLVAGAYWKSFPDRPHVQTGKWPGAPPAWARVTVVTQGSFAVWSTLFPALTP